MREAGRPSPPARPASAPAVAAAAAFVAGIGLGQWSVAGGVAAVVLAAGCLGLGALRIASGRNGALRHASVLLAFGALGFAEGELRIARPARLAAESFRSLPSEMASERTDRVEGVLQEFWTGAPPKAHGKMRAERLWDGRAWRPFPADVVLFVSGEAPLSGRADRGDRVVAVGRLRPEGPPASDRDVPLPGTVFRMSVKSALRLESPRATALSVLTAPNRWLLSRMPAPGARGEAFDRDVRGPLSALLLGRTSELDRGMVARYRRGGLYHLLVISGLHVGLAAALVLGLLRALSVRGRRRDAIVLAAVAAFVVVGGANPPAVRAGIVFAIFLAARLIERPISAAQAIGLSALVLFAAGPAQVHAIGTVLTFAAVSGIAAFAGPLRNALPRKPGFFFSGIAAAVAAQIGTAPALLWRFNIVSAGAWLTAPISIPIAAALIALGCLLLLFFAAGLPPGPVGAAFGAGSRLLEFFADRMAGIALLRPTPPLAAAVGVTALSAAGILAGRLPRPRVRNLLLSASGALYLVLAVRPGASGPERGFSVEALDVGQGDAFLLRWARHAVLVDGGGPFDLDARDFGRTRLLPKLLDRGVTRLDAALLTHPHPDHAIGLFAVLEEIPVGVLWRSDGQDEGDLFRDLERVARRRAVPVRVLRTGDGIAVEGGRWTILHSGGPRPKKDATNNQSVVALFERDGRRALLTGDAGEAAESELLRSGRPLSADLLKVGHHGSRGSTTPAFLAAVSPRIALVSCGRENRFGHPAPETLASLAAAQVRVFRTDIASDLEVGLFPRATRLKMRELP